MSSRSRQLLLLGALSVVFAVVLGRQLLPGLGGGGAVAPTRGSTTTTTAFETEGAVDIAVLRLEALEHKPAVYEPGRDPFRFGPEPRKPPSPKPDRTVRQVAKEKRRRQRPAEPPEPPKPQPPPVSFTYLGSFGLPGREIAVFTDGKEILNAFTGDVLQQEFVVRSIGYESADIGFVNFPDAPPKRLAVGG